MLWVGFGQVAAVLGSLVSIPLLTGALPLASYGEITLSFSMVILTNQVAMGPLTNAFLRFFAPAQEARQLPAYFKAARRLLIQGTLFLLLLALICGIACFLTGFGKWMPLLSAAFLLSLFFSYNSVVDGIQNAARHRAVVAWHQGLSPWLRLIMALEFVGLLEARVNREVFEQWASTTVMAGFAIGSILILVSQVHLFRRKMLPLLVSHEPATSNEIEQWGQQFRTYAWPFASWGVFSWMQQSSDRWALQAQIGTSDVGLYGPLYQLGSSPLNQLSTFASQVVSPIIFGRAGDGSDPERMEQSHQLSYYLFYGVLGLTLFLGVLTFFCHTQIFAWMVAPEYRGVSALLPLMIFSAGLFAAGQTAVLMLLTGVTTKVLIPPKIVTAILAVILNFSGARWLGLKGVVLAGVLSSFIYLIWVLILVRAARTQPDKISFL